MDLKPDQLISHYRVTRRIGVGGMGVVYEAIDTRLDRTVAIKILRPDLTVDPERRARFEREARLAASLSHPNIATIHEIGEADGVAFIVMERVLGTTLRSRMADGPMPTAEALEIAAGIADGLARAHEAYIVHRDLKPENILVEPDGRPRILDFGLAKLVQEWDMQGEAGLSAAQTAGPNVTREGQVVGTVAYMSPEQIEGKPLDGRSDLFSFGVLLYEMLSGCPPFRGDSPLSVISSILREEPAPLGDLRGGLPDGVMRIIGRCLAKDPRARPESAAEVRDALRDSQSRPSRRSGGWRHPAVAIAAVVLGLVAVAAAAWLATGASRARHAREVLLPEMERLVELDVHQAWLIGREARKHIPDDPRLRRLMNDITRPLDIRTDPAGARVWLRSYGGKDPGAWIDLGTTPLFQITLPLSETHFRLEKDGFETLHAAIAPLRELVFLLKPAGSEPAGMVRVPAGPVEFARVGAVEVPAFWIGRYEVTNDEYKAFVDAGGYRSRERWRFPFLRDGREIPWEEAMTEFRDATGRPGPAGWELGSYPDGEASHPVGGISWHEAAAYADFAGASLPTVFHWHRAASHAFFSGILTTSRFGGDGPAPVGSSDGVGPFGTWDMAGNVREWCRNRIGERRYALGGGWSDPPYKYRDGDALSPLDRSPQNGVRLIRTDEAVEERLLAPIEDPDYDFNEERPVDDGIFEVFLRLFTYDPIDLDPRVEWVNDESEHWREEHVTLKAAYADERVPVRLFLPRNAEPPYQTVVFFPSSAARQIRSSDPLRLFLVDFIPRSGRALIYPIYKGTYERHLQEPVGPNAYRDMVIQWSKDLQRTLDYLETRPDIDTGRLAYYGLSLGAEYGPILTAIEPRFKASVLLSGHLHAHQMDDPPEMIPLNYAPRSKVPVLMINGRSDFLSPIETSILPMFRLQGAPEEHKRLALFDGGHVPVANDVIREVLAWLDRYLGPVETTRRRADR